MPRSSRTPAARRSRSFGRNRLVALVLVAVALVVTGVGALKWAETRRGQAALLGLGSDRMHGQVQDAVDEALARILPGLATGAVHPDRPGDLDRPAPELGEGAMIRCRTVPVDGESPWWDVQARVAEALDTAGARVLWGERLPRRRGSAGARPDEEQDLLRLDVGVPGHPTHTLLLHRADLTPDVRWERDGSSAAWRRLRESGGPTVALVVDDWGNFRNATTHAILDLPVPLTLAVLPGLSYSRHFALQGTGLILPTAAATVDPGAVGRATAARRAAGCPVEVSVGRGGEAPDSRRREIMLHLPMQPQSWPDTDPGPRAVMVGMSRREIADRLDEALAGLLHVRGVNNHMGSAATSDETTMARLMAELDARGLYFVDSLTAAGSVAWDEAKRAGLPTARNRIFLDYDNEDTERIRSNLERLVTAARRTGFAIGICHPHAATAEVLAAEVARLAAQGVRFVTVSEFLALRGDQDDGA
ncbi:MAG: divergent polysaccharide deacetylase family protein [bacterium]|nr:divergent polysaccharide deacetylase family protein [bacterium]